jgi:glycine/D-amino acid oxidase-like deaminating enzyme
VCIVGGGYTGLWTAYYLLRADPALSVVVLEAEQVGYGASGRNGGWVSSLYPVSAQALAAEHGAEPARSMVHALQETVAEVGEVVAAEAIDCGFVQGGTFVGARSAAQVARARAEVEAGRTWGCATEWLEPAQASERVRMSRLLGATVNRHCARVHPRRLVDGLACAVRSRGGQIREGARVVSASPGRVVLSCGAVVRTRHTVRATEAWTARLPGLRRRVTPVYSLMVATEPLPEAVWAQIGLAGREVFADHRHVIVYGQRTVDDRIAFGGRGAPYHWGSAIRPELDSDPRVFGLLEATLHELFPVLRGYAVTHRWGGPLGISRDWHPSVGYDPAARLGWAGGYVGDGVAASNLAGRTLADLIRGVPSGLTRLPWVGHVSPSWEPEPLRWLGVNAGLRVAGWADAEESRTGRPAILGRALSMLTGH